MAGIKFSHPNPQVGDLYVRTPPTKVEWTYNLNTNIIDTYGGQVVQLLSMNFEKLTIEGQFGIEGAHGLTRDGAQLTKRPPKEFFDLNSSRGKNPAQPYKIGLTQMTAYFQNYFSIASQGAVRTQKGNLIRGHFDTEPMSLQYQSELESVMRQWTVYPTTFPSYSRSNEEFAPEFQIIFEVEEPDDLIAQNGYPAALKRLRAAVGYKAFSPYSDPLGASLYHYNSKGDLVPNKGKNAKGQFTNKALDFAKKEAEKQTHLVFDELGSLLPSMNEADLQELIQFGASMPQIYLGKNATATPKKKKKTRTSTAKFKKGDLVTTTLSAPRGTFRVIDGPKNARNEANQVFVSYTVRSTSSGKTYTIPEKDLVPSEG